MDIFFGSFMAMLDAMGKILLITLLAGILVRRGIIEKQYIKGLSEITVKVLLPALTFDKVVTTFDPYNTPGWWLLPLIGFVVPVLFMAITAIFYLPHPKKHMNKFPIASLQNVGYLVLPIGQILYPDQFDQFAIYVFLLILGFNIALWTIGKMLISYEAGKTEIKLAEMITPPFVANIFAMFLVFIKVNTYVPEIILEPVSMLGSAAVPLAMFILGATLGTISLKKLPKFPDIFKLSLVKYVLMPAFAFVVLHKTGMAQTNPLLATVLIIEASAAPAANLIVIVQKYGGDHQQTGSLMLIMYILAVFFMPLWLALWTMWG